MPGNPWPHDMVITVENDPHALLDLLWFREAWGLQPRGDDLPPRLVATPMHEPGTPDPSWTDAWPMLWRACLEHAGADRDASAWERLHAMPINAPERLGLLARITGPSPADELGAAAFPERHRQWSTARTEEIIAGHHRRRPLEEEPERASLDALVPAWRAGLTTIVVIPCRGTSTQRVGPNALLVTAETRDDPARYSAALATFA